MELRNKATDLVEEGFAKLIIRAVEYPDSPWINQLANVVEHKRFAKGQNYQQTFQLANKVTGIRAAEWDELMQRVDTVLSK